MRVVVVAQEPGAGSSVTVKGQLGDFTAIWRGEETLALGEVDVELSLAGHLRLTLLSSSEPIGVRPDGTVIAIVEHVGEDGVIGARIASDGILLIGPPENAPKLNAGSRIAVQADAVEVYPTNL